MLRAEERAMACIVSAEAWIAVDPRLLKCLPDPSPAAAILPTQSVPHLSHSNVRGGCLDPTTGLDIPRTDCVVDDDGGLFQRGRRSAF